MNNLSTSLDTSIHWLQGLFSIKRKTNCSCKITINRCFLLSDLFHRKWLHEWFIIKTEICMNRFVVCSFISTFFSCNLRFIEAHVLRNLCPVQKRANRESMKDWQTDRDIQTDDKEVIPYYHAAYSCDTIKTHLGKCNCQMLLYSHYTGFSFGPGVGILNTRVLAEN